MQCKCLKPGESQSLEEFREALPGWDEVPGGSKEEAWYFDRDGNPISRTEWAWLFAQPEYQIVRHWHRDEWLVSTVWLGLDHGFGFEETPIIYETMVFRVPGFEDYERRYATEGDAVAGHDSIVSEVKRRYHLSDDDVADHAPL